MENCSRATSAKQRPLCRETLNKEAACHYTAGNDDPSTVDFKPKIVANVDLQAQVPTHIANYDTAARKYALCRYTPAEWASANADLCSRSTDAQLAALATNRDCRQCMTECASRSDTDQKTNSRLLSARAQEIRSVLCDLSKVCWMCREEEEHLETQRQRVKRSIVALTTPALINAECLERRQNRLEQDLVADEVQEQLHQESCLIDSTRSMLQNLSAETWSQLCSLRNGRDLTEQDWSNKIKAGHLETECLLINTARCDAARLCPSATHLPFQQVDPLQWEQFSKENMAHVERQMAASATLRRDIEKILTTVARNLRSQADSVENALEKRISEIEECRIALEHQLDLVLQRIVDTEKLIADLQKASFNNGIPLRVAQQRLQIRKARPQPTENCDDPPQYGLLSEVQQSDGSSGRLQTSLEEAHKRLLELIKMRGHLESEIRVKRHSLNIDKLQCREIRAKFPSTLDISG
ncbi:tektin-4-like [Neocloeon triangulifer]|uniref:tektin-4-like n=1 Tax=Neocloeon triangulifer TaxID=2078957 RepID=UPI00286F6A3E|nr:tektin-4-like [Neocloeon triangulifer]